MATQDPYANVPVLAVPLATARVLNVATNGRLYAAVQRVVAAGKEPVIAVDRLPTAGGPSRWTIRVLGEAHVDEIEVPPDRTAVIACSRLFLAGLVASIRDEILAHYGADEETATLSEFMPPWGGSREPS